MATATSLGFSLFSTWDPKGARQARKELTGLQRVSKDLGETARIGFGAAAVGAIAYGAALLKAGIASNALQQRANAALLTTTGSVQAAKEQMAELKAFGKESPISLPVWVKAQQQMLAFGVESAKVVPMLGAIQDAVIAAGGTEEEIKGVVRALSQMQSKGKLSAEELNQMGERGIDAAGVVAKAFGTTSQDIRARITEGRITVDEFFDGFIKGSEMAFGGAAQNARLTFDGMVDRLKGAHRRIGELLARPLVNPDGGGALVTLGNAIADAMNDAEEALAPVMDILARRLEPATERIADNIRELGEQSSTEGIFNFIDRIKDGLPIITAFGAALSAKMAGGFLEALPGMQRFAGALSPVVFAIGALAATSPELRSALSDVNDAIQPLLPVLASMATIVANVLSASLKAVTPLIVLGANAIEMITDNLHIVVPLFLGAATALYVYARATTTLNAATLLSVIAGNKLRDTLVALRTAAIAHPVLALATGLAVLGGIIFATEQDASQLAQTIGNDLMDSLRQISTEGLSSQTNMENMGHELERLRDLMQENVPAVGDFVGAIRALDDVNWDSGELFNEEDAAAAAAYVEVTQELDKVLAGLVEEGMSTSAIMALMNEELGISAAQFEEIKPHMDEYLAAQIEAQQKTQELADSLGNAVAGLAGLGAELKTQSDPYFAMIKAQGDYNDALEKYNTLLADPEASESDRAQAALALGEALLGAQIAAENAGTVLGTELPEDLLALGKAYGVPDSALQDLEDSFATASETAVTAAENMVSSSASAAARVAESLGMMSGSAAEDAALMAEQLNGLASNGGDVAFAFEEMGRRSGIGRQGVIESMLAMREAGFDFSEAMDTYLDQFSTSTDETKNAVTTDVDAMIQKFGEMAADTKQNIDDMMDKGYSYEDSVMIMAMNTGLSVDEIKGLYDGLSLNVEENAAEMREYIDGLGAREDALARTSEDMSGVHQKELEDMSSSSDDYVGNMVDRFQDMMDNAGWVEDAIKSMSGTWIGRMIGMTGATSKAWSSIRSAVSKPVNFIVGNLYNDGIRNMWNFVTKAMFGNKNRLSEVKGFATGGLMRGPGTSTSDSIPIMASAGEYMVKASSVRKYGTGFMSQVNAGTYEPPGFFTGGLITKATGALVKGASKIMGALDDAGGSDWFGDWFGIAGKAAKMLTGLQSTLGKVPMDDNGKPFGNMVKSGASKAINRIADLLSSIEGVAGNGASLGGFQGMFKWIKSVVPSARLNSGFRQGDPGYHGKGLAVDLGFGDRSEFRGGGDALKAFNAIAGVYKKATAELIWDYSPWSSGSSSIGIWNGNRHTFGSATSRMGTHADHVHWAMSQGGGKGGGMGAFGGKGGSGRWAGTVNSVLRELGLHSEYNMSMVLKAIQKESSGNPNSINTWDSNAKMGIPSKGLLQTIDPTFNAWAGPYRKRGPYDPYANIYAAIRYAKNRYGSGWAERMARPGGYAEGIKSAPAGPAWVGEEGPELMNFRGGESVTPLRMEAGGDIYNTTININGTTFGNKRQVAEEVLEAVEDLHRKKRLPKDLGK